MGARRITPILDVHGHYPPGTMIINPYILQAPASGYLVEENFETGLAPSGWTTTSGWTWNNTSPVFQGTYSPRVNDFGAPHAYKAFTGQSEVFAYFVYRTADVTPSSDGRNLARFTDSSGNTQVFISQKSDGTVRLMWGDFAALDVTGALADNTWYHFWLRYKKGTGANAITSIGISTDGIRPTSGSYYKELLTGTFTTDAARVYIEGQNGMGVNTYFDRYLVSTSQIGDNP